MKGGNADGKGDLRKGREGRGKEESGYGHPGWGPEEVKIEIGKGSVEGEQGIGVRVLEIWRKHGWKF